MNIIVVEEIPTEQNSTQGFWFCTNSEEFCNILKSVSNVEWSYTFKPDVITSVGSGYIKAALEIFEMNSTIKLCTGEIGGIFPAGNGVYRRDSGDVGLIYHEVSGNNPIMFHELEEWKTIHG